MYVPEPLADLLASAPRSPEERAGRWSAAVEAVARAWPASRDGGISEPRVVRIAFHAIDLFVFRAAFTALYDGGPPPWWAWRLDHGASPCDAWVEREVIPGSDDAGDGWSREPDVGIELVVNASSLSAAFASGARRPARFDDHAAETPLEAVVGALGRRMIRIAAQRCSDGPAAADALALRLTTAFGDGPGEDGAR